MMADCELDTASVAYPTINYPSVEKCGPVAQFADKDYAADYIRAA